MSATTGGGGAVVRQGHLRKLKTMKKKFFVLRGDGADNSGRLEYYESEKKFKAGAAPRRVLMLKTCFSITRRLDLKQKHVIALFTKEEQFCVVAENEQDLHEWLSAILKLHHPKNSSIEELLNPIQHVWQVNVQKKGLGASQNIQGLYNLCLSDVTLTLVKIKSQNNVISDLGIPEKIEYTLKHIRRCGDSECFFYMEVGRQTATGSGELWMLSDDSNIAQSMHSTIYHAMQNCAKKAENEKDHIMVPNKGSNEGTTALPERRQSYCGGARGRAGLANAENHPPNNSLTNEKPDNLRRVFNHHRTVSLPTGYPSLQEPLKIVHERTRSAPLTGEELDRAIIEKTAMHSSCKAVNGTEVMKKSQWSRRASTGTRLSKLSPAHTKNASTLRNRCDSMPSKVTSSFEMDRSIPRLSDHIDGVDSSRDEIDSLSEWYRTPRIPEEPDICDIVPKDFISALPLLGSRAHSRTSSLCGSDSSPPAPPAPPARYLPMAPPRTPAPRAPAAPAGDVCSGTPSSDPRFSEYQLEPARWQLSESERPPRAYSVGSRPAGATPARLEARLRAYSVGARNRPHPHPAPAPTPHTPTPHTPTPHTPTTAHRHDDDHMELDFSTPVKVIVARTPPTTVGFHDTRQNVDEYVDMSPRSVDPRHEPRTDPRHEPRTDPRHEPRTDPRHKPRTDPRHEPRTDPRHDPRTDPTSGYVEMKPGDLPATPAATEVKPPDGYVEMNYTRPPTRPINIVAHQVPPRPPCPPASVSPPRRTPRGSGTLFPLSLESPDPEPQPPAPHPAPQDEHHHLSTVRETSEECPRRSPERVSNSPQYVKLVPIPDTREKEAVSCVTVVVPSGLPPARFTLPPSPAAPPAPPASPAPPVLHYAALDLESRPGAPPQPTLQLKHYSKIDFRTSDKVHAADN